MSSIAIAPAGNEHGDGKRRGKPQLSKGESCAMLDSLLEVEELAVLDEGFKWLERAIAPSLEKLSAQIDGLNTKIDGLDRRTGERFESLEKRTDERFARMDERFAGMEKRMDERFTGFEKRMGERFAGFEKRMDERFAGMDKRMDERFTGFEKLMDERFTGMDKLMDERFTGLRNELRVEVKRLDSKIDDRLIPLTEMVRVIVNDNRRSLPPHDADHRER